MSSNLSGKKKLLKKYQRKVIKMQEKKNCRNLILVSNATETEIGKK